MAINAGVIQQTSISDFQSVDGGVNPSRPHHLVLIPAQNRKRVAEIIEKYHGYKNQANYVGRQINWMISYDREIVGTIGIGSAPIFLPQVLYNALGIKSVGGHANLTLNLNRMAVNWRFTLTDRAPKNAGSQAISLMVKLAPKAWKTQYRDDLALLFTFVGAGRSGSVYLASNWEYAGITEGNHFQRGEKFGRSKFHQGVSRWTDETGPKDPKRVFYKTLRKDWKELMVKCPSKTSAR